MAVLFVSGSRIGIAAIAPSHEDLEAKADVKLTANVVYLRTARPGHQVREVDRVPVIIRQCRRP